MDDCRINTNSVTVDKKELILISSGKSFHFFGAVNRQQININFFDVPVTQTSHQIPHS